MITRKDRWKFNGFLVLEQFLGARLFSLLFASRKRALIHSWQRKLAGKPEGKLLQIDRRSDLDPETFRREYLDRGLPVIFEGAAKDWPCTRKWNLQYLASGFGERDVLLVDAEGLSGKNTERGFEILPLKDLVGDISSGGKKYLRFSPLLQNAPNLAQDVNFDWLDARRAEGTFGNTYYLFVGPRGTKTFLHSDQPCNLFVQIHGQKKWILFRTEDSVFLDPQVGKTGYFTSPVDPERPDPERFPLFKYADRYEVTLNPGDVMYVPPHLWHHVSNLTETIAVGYRFSSLKAALRSSAVFTFLRACAMNPPIWKTRKYGKIDTNLIWAHANGKIREVLAAMGRRKKERRI